MELKSELILVSQNIHTKASLCTFILTYPRCILAEVNTHRMLSRNTASSRAIPSKKQRERVLHNPFVPISIGQNQKGMQAGAELTGWREWAAYKTWELARYPNVLASWVLDKLGAHKQVVNRIVEPWTWTQQIVTATDWKNVFKLRNHGDAEPHFHALAAVMEKQVQWAEGWMRGDHEVVFSPNPGVGRIQFLGLDEWHLPFVTDEEKRSRTLDIEALKQISAARCARVSYYLPENGKLSDPKRDIELCQRLSSSGHWSPFEHIATPISADEYVGNFRSWKQYRKCFSEEHGGDRVLGLHELESTPRP